MDILGVKIDNLEKTEILDKVECFLAGDKLCQIATVNPEFILTARKDVDFRKILNSCDLNVADGIGIKFAFWRHGQKLKCRLTGADLMYEILKMANDRGVSIFLAANKEGLSTWEETRDVIKKEYPNLEIIGINMDKNNPNYQLLISNCNILFCNFGAPYQEKFLHSLKNQKNDKIRLVMGVGGSFDFWTGRVHRAPLWMRKNGLEWLFRLIQEPRYRIKRIFNAVIIFPIKVAFNK